jgi:hypothetical protein
MCIWQAPQKLRYNFRVDCLAPLCDVPLALQFVASTVATA